MRAFSCLVFYLIFIDLKKFIAFHNEWFEDIWMTHRLANELNVKRRLDIVSGLVGQARIGIAECFEFLFKSNFFNATDENDHNFGIWIMCNREIMENKR